MRGAVALLIVSSRRRTHERLLSAGIALVAVGMAACQRLPTRAERLAQFHVPSGTVAAEDAVADTLRMRLPAGVALARVAHFLDSLGYARTQRFVSRPHYRVYPEGPYPAIEAAAPYHESFFSSARFVCDQAAIRLSFRFDGDSRLREIAASSARGCI